MTNLPDICGRDPWPPAYNAMRPPTSLDEVLRAGSIAGRQGGSTRQALIADDLGNTPFTFHAIFDRAKDF